MSKSYEELREYVINYAEIGDAADVIENDCAVIEYLLDNCEIHIPPENRFFVSVGWSGFMDIFSPVRHKQFDEQVEKLGLHRGVKALAFTGMSDFSHTSAEWDSVISLGISGLRSRLAEFSVKNKDTATQRFYRNTIKVYDAALRLIRRAAEEAEKVDKQEMAEGLYNLSEKAPETLFEAMQTTIIYYVLQTLFENTYLRTLGRLDTLLYPFYIREDKLRAEEMVLDYLREIDRLKAPSNIPFAIGGTDKKGNSLVNELSYVFARAYDMAETNNTKFHMLCADNTPQDIILMCFDSIRKGNNSIVLMSDSKIIEALTKLGEDREDAVDYHVVGCYECGGRGELTCSCSSRVSILKALEYTLNKGRDMLTGELIGLGNSGDFGSYEELFSEFLRQLDYLCECAMRVTDIYEAGYAKLHCAPFLSGTYSSAVENGRDLYCGYSAKYNNSSVNGVGLATAVDSLAAIRKLVYEDREMSLERLTEILKNNWEGEETLRLRIKNKFPKFGTADERTDEIAVRITNALADFINGKPNAKGGIYRLGLFSIDWRWGFGITSGASADGRLKGETVSQNTSASFGADKKGATAHLISVARIDSSNTPNGAIADIDLHSSAVKGENGSEILLAMLKTYFRLGGFAVHYNVLDTEVLKKAREDSEAYPNLQVRLCGWNALFSSLSDKQKDEFIERSE